MSLRFARGHKRLPLSIALADESAWAVHGTIPILFNAMIALELEESAALATLLRGESPQATKQRRALVATSIVGHLIAVPLLGLVTLEAPRFRNAPEIIIRRQQVTPLIAPRMEQLTQREPNHGIVSKEINLDSLLPKPEIQQKPGAQAKPRQMAALPTMGATVGGEKQDLIEAPKIDAAAVAPTPTAPLAALGSPTPLQPSMQTAPAPPPKPQMQFERPGSVIGTNTGSSSVALPNTSVSEAMRAVSQGRGGGGNQVVADFSVPSAMGGASSKGAKQRGSVELLSDPNGIDFKPYLVQVLASVKRNWFAVMPQSARYGSRGQVQIQFVIRRDGSVPKLVIASTSATEPLNRAAVAGVSASNPFPPLPREFNGNEVRLQFTFSYNVD